MIVNHVSIGVPDVAAAGRFYDAVLGALGIERYWEMLPKCIAYGEDFYEFWIQLPDNCEPSSVGNGVHVAFNAPSQAAVHAFYDAALAHGGSDAGEPGPRPDYGADYYGAFVRDPFGNKIEAAVKVQRIAQAKLPLPPQPAKKKPAAKRARKAAPARKVKKTASPAKKAAAKTAKAKTAKKTSKKKAKTKR